MNERDAVNEAEAVVSGKLKEEDKQTRIQIPFGAAFEIAIHLDVSRLAHEARKKVQTLTPEELEEIPEIRMAKMIDEIGEILVEMLEPDDNPETNWLNDPNSLIERPVSGELDNSPSTQGPPFEETLLWVLADKFPSVSELAADADKIRARSKSNETYELSLSQREVVTLGHSILQSIYEDEEEFPKPPDNPDFLDVERAKFRRLFKHMNTRLIRAYSSLYRAFIEAGGTVDMQLYEALNTVLRKLK